MQFVESIHFATPDQISRKENPTWCFKFDDLNLELAETIEILKAAAQLFGKSELFETMKIVYTILQYFLLTVLGLGSHYHARIVLGHSAASPTTFDPTTRCHFSC